VEIIMDHISSSDRV